MTLILSAVSLLVAAVALYVAAQNRRRVRLLGRVADHNAEAFLTLLEGLERRLNQLETYAYSGGTIDQRKKDGGVW